MIKQRESTAEMSPLRTLITTDCQHTTTCWRSSQGLGNHRNVQSSKTRNNGEKVLLKQKDRLSECAIFQQNV